MTVLYFGIARDCAECSSETLDWHEGLTVAKLWETLIALHPALGRCRPMARVAVAMRYVSDNEAIPSDAEVAIIPPVAGG